jgi:hypothetical protein
MAAKRNGIEATPRLIGTQHFGGEALCLFAKVYLVGGQSFVQVDRGHVTVLPQRA